MVDMKKYKYILFDLDGTLVYSHPGIFACFRYALEKMGWPHPTDKELLPCIGPSLHYSFTTFIKLNNSFFEFNIICFVFFCHRHSPFENLIEDPYSRYVTI